MLSLLSVSALCDSIGRTGTNRSCRYMPQIYHSSSSRLYLNDSLSTLNAKSANNRRNKSVFKRILTGVRHNVVSLKWLAILCDHILYILLHHISYIWLTIRLLSTLAICYASQINRNRSKAKTNTILHIVFYIVEIGVREMSLEHYRHHICLAYLCFMHFWIVLNWKPCDDDALAATC